MEIATSKTNIAIKPEKLEVVVTRIFNAPKELLYKVFTDPKHKAIWWRCNSVTNIFVQMDVRPGGSWRIIQKDNDGKEFAFHGEYLEVIPIEKI
ncbi:MAG TPA: SRPBCC domain-containing protein, partial [Bacteroidia bacterium]|nr:SRPBCC domain-containing protein [Bacteroidia bacterium]